MSRRPEPVAVIAGSGRLPFLVAAGVRAAGRPVVILALRGLASVRLKHLADEFAWIALTRLGGWMKALHRYNVRQAVMIGGVRKTEMYTPLRLLRYIPDLRTAMIWYSRLRKDKRDKAVLLAVADELRGEGVELVSSVEYCTGHLAGAGVLTRTSLPGGVEDDVSFGWRIARASADLDIGQSIAVKERDIIAVEAMEGTDAMIRRAGRLCRVGGWTMVKVARPQQDMRFDVPCIGPNTIRHLKDAHCVCLVVEADKTLIVDKPATLALADSLGIAIIGKTAE